MQLRKEEVEKAKLEKERVEAEIKEKELNAKKEKEVIKKALKKEKKTLRTVCKTNNYYGTDDKSIIDNMASMETLCEVLDCSE